ncbi:hypothetical protein Gotri_026880, partial [Gossypium trilobum]|nr:hypothetical protein [Gossypium trilobum]
GTVILLFQPAEEAGNGAKPASAAVISLQGIVSRESNPLDSQVVSVTSFNGGNNLNMIPDTVVIGGTFRAFSNASFYNLLQRIQEVVVEQAMNDDHMYEHVKKVATDLLGPTNFRVVPPMMGAEDFSFYTEIVPAAFYYIGVRNETLGSIHTGHSPYFMIDEDVLPIGAAVHASIAERYLNERG